MIQIFNTYADKDNIVRYCLTFLEKTCNLSNIQDISSFDLKDYEIVKLV